MTFIEHLLEYARKELKITNFDQSELGNTILNFLEQSAKITNNDTDAMKQLVNMLVLLVEQRPISPITEDDVDEEIPLGNDSDEKMWRCSRYEHLYKTADGKYWDDRAIAFKFHDSAELDRIFLYQPTYNSKQEVTLPYYPSCQIKVINRDDIS